MSAKKIRRFVRDQGIDGYVETSAKSGGGADVERVFKEAVRVAIGGQGDSDGGDGDADGGGKPDFDYSKWCKIV